MKTVKEQKFKLSKCKNVNTLQTQTFENGQNTKIWKQPMRKNVKTVKKQKYENIQNAKFLEWSTAQKCEIGQNAKMWK